MARLELANPFDEMAGKFSKTDRIVLRTRYGRTHAYAYRHPYKGPISENRKPIINAFSQAVKQCKSEMSDPERLAYWQDRYARYTKLAKRNTVKANMQFVGTNTDKYYVTLRGFIIAVLSAQLRASE